jgi:hypothetical protein
VAEGAIDREGKPITCDQVTFIAAVKMQNLTGIYDYRFLIYFIIEPIIWKISSLLLNIQIQNTQTLLLFTMIIKMENIYKNY